MENLNQSIETPRMSWTLDIHLECTRNSRSSDWVIYNLFVVVDFMTSVCNRIYHPKKVMSCMYRYSWVLKKSYERHEISHETESKYMCNQSTESAEALIVGILVFM